MQQHDTSKTATNTNVPQAKKAPSQDHPTRSTQGKQKQQLARDEPSSQSSGHGGGLPADLKQGIEQLSNISMDDVHVHYNSPKPSQLGAFAYAQGPHIYLAPGQEKHLPHEAWHVVQQKRGLVSATKNVDGIPVNQDDGLEQDAQAMGAKALEQKHSGGEKANLENIPAPTSAPVQCFAGEKDVNTKRRTAAKDKTKRDMKLDHIVSQDALKGFFDELVSLEPRFVPKKCLFTKSKEAFGVLLETAESKTNLINIPANIVPGYRDSIGDPGNVIDPHIVMEGNVAEESGISDTCYNLDLDLRKFSRLYNSIPTQGEITQEKHYNEELDNKLAQIMSDIEEALTELASYKAPAFDGDTWYPYGQKMVKKMPGIYLDQVPADLGEHRHNYPDWTAQEIDFEWVKDGEVPVTFSIYIDETALKHIYDRHTIEGFAGKVEPRNSFFPTQDALLEFIDESEGIKADMELAADRLFNIELTPNEQSVNYNMEGMLCNHAFYHGRMDASCAFDEYRVDVNINTIAPQDSASAIVFTPDMLDDFIEQNPERFNG